MSAPGNFEKILWWSNDHNAQICWPGVQWTTVNTRSKLTPVDKGGVTLCNFPCSLSRSTVATQFAEELHGVKCYLCNLFRNIFVARNVARSRTQFYFLQRLQQLSIAVAQCNHPSSNLSRNALLDQLIRILIILSSVLLGRSFGTCWQSLCTV